LDNPVFNLDLRSSGKSLEQEIEEIKTKENGLENIENEEPGKENITPFQEEVSMPKPPKIPQQFGFSRFVIKNKDDTLDIARPSTAREKEEKTTSLRPFSARESNRSRKRDDMNPLQIVKPPSLIVKKDKLQLPKLGNTVKL